ncbi:hypothetical protein MMC13_005936 [Lambiella insularis]|nr:hypothetical protein [Lambiella insularis]
MGNTSPSPAPAPSPNGMHDPWVGPSSPVQPNPAIHRTIRWLDTAKNHSYYPLRHPRPDAGKWAKQKRYLTEHRGTIKEYRRDLHGEWRFIESRKKGVHNGVQKAWKWKGNAVGEVKVEQLGCMMEAMELNGAGK